MIEAGIKQGRQAGFTLIEIMVVVAIIGILAAVVVPNVVGRVDDANIAKAKQDIQALQTALEFYKLDNFVYPTTDQGLQALVEEPSSDPVPAAWKDGGYIKKLNKDPWGRDYLYLSPGERGEIDVYSLGKDGAPGGDNDNADISNHDI